MKLEEWKHYRNITVKEIKTISDKVLATKLGIDYNLAADIRNGVYNWQIRLWDRINKRQVKEPKKPIPLIDWLIKRN